MIESRARMAARGFFFAGGGSKKGTDMRLVTYLDSTRHERVGLGVADGVIADAAGALEWLSHLPHSPACWPAHAATDMLTVIREFDAIGPALRAVIDAFHAGKVPSALLLQESSARIVSPIPRPLSMRDGYAFRQHVETARRNRGLPMIPEFDQFPVFYFTNHLGVTGPGDVAVEKLARDKLDFEREVALVIGRVGRNIAAADADSFIFGYMVMNDWSARALQMEEMKLNLGPAKGKDFATSLGPYLITRDELASRAVHGPHGERHDLGMRAFVNGKQLSNGNLKDMNWTFAQLVERASYGVTLRPGEVIGSGTVGTGCLLELNGSKITDNLWLKPGDEVVMEVDGLGRLVNRVVAAEGGS
jgi:fumarylacetoacetate (FAA) hydrolase